MTFPIEIFNLDGCPPTLAAVMQRLEPLNLQWQVAKDDQSGGSKAQAILYYDKATAEVWAFGVLENAAAGRHEHNAGGPYGELIISLAGEIDDIKDNGEPVKVRAGGVLFHGPNTVHQARAKFWAGFYHQPRGCTPVPETANRARAGLKL